MNQPNQGRMLILDATLRDGGLGLEDAAGNQGSCLEFSDTDRNQVAELLSVAKIDVIELGSIEVTPDDRRGFAIYQDIQHASEAIPKQKQADQMFAALYRGPDTPIEAIPEWDPSLCEGVRVILRYSELQKSLDFCAALSAKGYKVFVQPMLTMRYSEEEIERVIKSSNDMNAYAVYFVDSYGYMQRTDVRRFFERYEKELAPNIKIGFHAHNNMNLAFSNALDFMELGQGREIVLDACLLGMGQGAGNLQTELLIGYLQSKGNSQYDYGAVLDGCEIIEEYTQQGLWGYSVDRLLSAIYQTAYKYSIALRNHYGLSYREIANIFSQVPEDLRHRYTPENTIELLRRVTH